VHSSQTKNFLFLISAANGYTDDLLLFFIFSTIYMISGGILFLTVVDFSETTVGFASKPTRIERNDYNSTLQVLKFQ